MARPGPQRTENGDEQCDPDEDAEKPSVRWGQGASQPSGCSVRGTGAGATKWL